MVLLFFIPGWLIFAIALFVVAGVNLFLQFLPILLIGFVLLVITGILLKKFPIATIAILSVISVACIGYVLFFGPNGLISKNVEIYVATGDCLFYDEDYSAHTIREGSVFALYKDSKQYSEEEYPSTKLVVNYRRYCVVHDADGNEVTFFVATIPDMYNAEEFGVTVRNEWNSEKIADINLLEFKTTEWWQLASS